MLAEMFTMAPGNKDHQVAIRCAIGVFIPLITLVLLDRLDLAIFASFGAFAGIYGRNEPHARRSRLQFRAGALMLVVMLLAALTARAAVAFGLTAAETIWLQVVRDHPGGRKLLADRRLVAAPPCRLVVPHLCLRRDRVHPQPAAALAGHARGAC